ncbi:hypothetical protein SNEBB_004194 [Seison nebaliae]|nr:hypothetical protein SNEBB_004194 [Seison nebaliae]
MFQFRKKFLISLRNYSEKKCIKIPSKIERKSTDILSGLASTIKPVNDAPHYMYVDDPWLIPRSLMEKKTYALSKISGERTAEFIGENHELFFRRSTADPNSFEFQTKFPKFSEEKLNGYSSDIELLWDLISHGRLLKTSEIYLKMKEKNENFLNSQPELLETLIYSLILHGNDDFDGVIYKSNENLLVKCYEQEFWFKRSIGARLANLHDLRNINILNQLLERSFHTQILPNTWNDDGPVDKLLKYFNEENNEKKNLELTSARIRLLSKNNESEKIEEIWKKFLKHHSQIQSIDIDTMNVLIRMIPLNYNYYNEKEEEIKQFLKLSKTKCQLNYTSIKSLLNSSLYSLRRSVSHPKKIAFALQLFDEFQRHQIQPDLETFTHLLLIFYPHSTTNDSILLEILEKIEKNFEQFPIRTEYDSQFFAVAMNRCNVCLNDVLLCERIHELFLKYLQSSSGLEGSLPLIDEIQTIIYYSNYLNCQLEEKSFEEFMEIWSELVPNTFSPSPIFFEKVLKQMLNEKKEEFRAKLKSDAKLLGFLSERNKDTFIATIFDDTKTFVNES